MDELPRLIVTGASGFVGRRLLETLRGRYRVYAVDRLAPPDAEARALPYVSWHQLDIAEREPLARLLGEIRGEGPVAALLHLAAYYDFTGDDHPEYERTNVEGTRLLLELSRPLDLERFVFASSVAACAFPPPGGALTEATPPDGDHLYAISKRRGEELVRAASTHFPTAIVRFAALFSDWCEYAPLALFLDTWLSRRWNARILGGRGRSAVPYLHVRDVVIFLDRVLSRRRDLEATEVLIGSPDGANSHQQLFEAATAYAFGRPRRPLFMPKPLAAVGIRARDLAGRAIGQRPFERPWMAAYIDLALAVDASRTRARLDWQPRERLGILRRFPFLIENLRTDPAEWYRRNHDLLHLGHLHPNLKVLRLLELHDEEISRRFTAVLIGKEGQARLPHYRETPAEEHAWHHRLILHNLMQAVRTRERGIFLAYCRDLAERRARQGYGLEEVSYALRLFERVCREALATDSEAELIPSALREYITVTVDYGIDAVEDVFESLAAGPAQPV